MTIADIESFRLCLDAIAREGRYLAFLEAPPLPAVQSYMRRSMEAGSPRVVAIADGRVIGWCDIELFTHEGFRHRGRLGMGVLCEYRGRGIGGALLSEAVALARQKRLERVDLEVFASNGAAIRLYEQAGFVREGLKAKGRKIGSEYDDVVDMVLFL